MLAVLLLIGFCVVALSIVALLVWLPLALGSPNFTLTLSAWAGAAVVLWSILPRPDTFVDPGPQLSRNVHPRLFAEIESVARSTGQAPPAQVFLVHDANAFVSERGGMLGFGSRRVMGLGLPLLHSLDVAEARAVLAHEFGHFHGGDTRLGPWVYKTRAAIGRTLANLQEADRPILHFVFELYGNFFVRVSESVSRAQELAADALAARTVGASTLASSLRRIVRVAPAYQTYFAQEVVPLLERGRRPPLLAGFGMFVGQPQIVEQVERLVEASSRRQADPWDSHPPLGERLAALRAGDAELTGAMAITLLDDPNALELELLRFLVPDHDVGGWPGIEWHDACELVLLPMWRHTVQANRSAFEGLTWRTFPHVCRDAEKFARKALKLEVGDPGQRGSEAARWLLDCALAVTLADVGWSGSSLPGAEITFRREDDELRPFGLAAKLAHDVDAGQAIVELAERHGFADRALVP
ncbi:MAG: M48 family metallopeptidase [Planctomycetes bacterium]|nr:M48 family metallopeptidase [Planctomycetota bacterium]